MKNFTITGKLLNCVLVISFLTAISIPVLHLVMRGLKLSSPTEKRNLAQFPHLDRHIIKARTRRIFEEAFNDQFGFREQLTIVHNRIKFYLGISPTDQVFFGKDGWLFYTGNNVLQDFMYGTLLSQQELENWKIFLEIRRDQLKSRGIEYLFVIAPNKHTIYSDKLYVKKGKTSRCDQLMDFLRQNSDVPVLDLRAPLLEAKLHAQVYDKTDTHWNDIGANIAQYHIAKSIARLFPETMVPFLYPTDAYQYHSEPGGDLYTMLGLGRDIFEPKPHLSRKNDNYSREEWKEDEIIDKKKGERLPVLTTKSHEPGNLNILCFRDSFFTALQPYLSSYPVQVTYVWKHFPDQDTFEFFVNRVSPRLVIEETVERLLQHPLPLKHYNGRVFSDQ